MKMILPMVRILSIFCGAMLWTISAGTGPAHGESSDENIVVVELFTSQGCSSCPPADDVLAEFSEQDNVLALSYSVDYWNYLGWKDTLAMTDCTVRQQKYNISLGKNGIYTPQMIIQGNHDLIGSRRSLARQTVTQTRMNMQPRQRPEISFDPSGNMINLTISPGADSPVTTATIWIIGYDYEKTVTITKGELSGQVRKYHNVVQAIKRIGSWTGGDTRLTLSRQDIGERDYDGYALLLQASETGPIIAAAKLSLE